MRYLIFISMLLVTAAFGTAHAQDDDNGWTGEGAFGAGLTTGNTDTVDVSVGVKIAKEAGKWKYAAEGGYEFGQTNDIDTRDRWYVAGQVDREFSERLFGFTRASYEQDQFSGFESRLFVGAGAGYHIFKGDKLRWSVDIAPGYRIDEIAFGPTERNIAVRAGSAFAYDFNDNVGFTNDTSVVWSDVSTQTINTSALNAKLTQAITARISFEVRNDTNPPAGFVSTDTATRVSIVYGF